MIPQLAGAVLALSDLIDAYHARMTADIAKGLSRSDDDEWMANRCQRLRRTLCGDLAEEQALIQRAAEDAEYETGEATHAYPCPRCNRLISQGSEVYLIVADWVCWVCEECAG